MVAGVLLVLALSSVYYVLSSNQSSIDVQSDTSYTPDVDPKYNNSGARDRFPPVSEILATLENLPRFEQVAELHQAFNETAVVDLRRAFVEAQSDASSLIHDEVQVAIIRRLASLDPREGIKLIDGTSDEKRELFRQELFGELSIVSFEDAVSLAAEIDNPKDRQAIVKGIIQVRDDLSTDILLDAAGRLGAKRVALDHIAASQAETAVHDPIGSWNMFFSVHGSDIDELSSAQFDLLTSIAGSWIDQAGTHAMQEIFSSLRSVKDRIQVFSRLLNNASLDDAQLLQSIIKWLNLTDRFVLTQSFAEWGASAPQSALDLIQSMNLGAAQQLIERAAIDSWIRNDPSAVLENLDDVTEDLRMFVERAALRAMTRTTPEAVPAWIDGISDKANKEITVDSLVDNWAQQDPKATLNWIMANESHVGPHLWSYLSTVLPSLVEDEPQLALKVALEHPETDSEVGLEALVIGGLATVDFDQAVAALASARNQETREAAYIAIGRSLVDKGDAKRAIELAEDLPKDKQMSYYSGFSTKWASNPEDLLENLDRLPSRDIQLMLVRETLLIDRIAGSLTPEQRAELNTYMSEQGN